MCAVGYQEVNEVARRLDGEVTVLSLEPVSIEGILNTIQTVGAMTEAEDAAIDVVEDLRERLRHSRDRRRPPRPRVPCRRGSSPLERLDPPFAVGHWVPDQVRHRRRLGAARARAAGASPTTWDAVREVDPEMLVLMPGGCACRGTVEEWARLPRARGLGRRSRPSSRAACSSPTARRLLRGPARASSTASRSSPSSSIPPRSTACRPTAAGSASASSPAVRAMPFRDRFDCLWCGTPHMTRAPTTSRAGRSCARPASARPATNPFLRARLRRRSPSAGARRGREPSTTRADRRPRRRRHAATPKPVREPPAGRGPFPDDWFLRRGPFEHGAIHDAAWNAELDVVTRWIDGARAAAAGSTSRRPASGSSRRCWRSRASSTPPTRTAHALDLARDRLVAHRLARPSPCRGPVGRHRARTRARRRRPRRFLLGRVRGAGLDRALALAARAARPPAAGSRSSTCSRPAGRPAGRDRRGRGTTPRCWRRPSPGPASTRSAITTTGRFFLLDDRRAAIRDPRGPSADPGAILRRDVTPCEPHDRHRRLRRHGRGDDRRTPPRRPSSSPARSSPATRAPSAGPRSPTPTASGSSRPTSRRSRAPT